MPVLYPENQRIWDIFEILRTQMRVSGMGEFIGYDLSTADMLMDIYEVPRYERQDTIEALALLNNVSVKIAREAKENS